MSSLERIRNAIATHIPSLRAELNSVDADWANRDEPMPGSEYLVQVMFPYMDAHRSDREAAMVVGNILEASSAEGDKFIEYYIKDLLDTFAAWGSTNQYEEIYARFYPNSIEQP